MTDKTISLIGNLYLDRAYVLDHHLHLGQTNVAASAFDQVGGLANVARGLHELDPYRELRIHSQVGSDVAGKILREMLEAENTALLAIQTIEDAATTTATILIERAARQRSSVVAWGACTQAPLPAVTDADWCHLAYLDCMHGAELDALLALGSNGATVSADLCRSDLDDMDRNNLLSLFAAVDYLIVSDVECWALLGSADVNSARQLGRAVRGTAIVHHTTGSFSSDGETTQSFDLEGDSIVDNVLGAGDAFAAGFIHNSLRGQSVASAIEMAHDFATASLAVRS